MKQDDYFESQDFRELLNQYEAAHRGGRRIYMDGDDLADIAEYYINNHRDREADTVLSEGLRMHPDNPELLYLRTEQTFDRGHAEEACQEARRILMMHPDHTPTKELYLEILLDLQYCTEAVHVAEELLDRDAYNAEVWHMLADAQTALYHYDAALESIEYGLSVNPGDDDLLHAKGVALIQLERYKEADEVLAEYLRRHPEDDHALYNRSIALTCLERYEDASALLDHATMVSKGQSSEQTQIYLQQAYIEAKMGHRNEALLALDLAKETKQLCPPSDGRHGSVMEEADYENIKAQILELLH